MTKDFIPTHNTAPANDRDGGQVMERNRALDWWHYCIAIDYPEAPAMPGIDVFTTPIPLGGAPLVSTMRNPVGPGGWVLLEDGTIVTVNGAEFFGAPKGKNYFAGRKAAKFEPHPDGRRYLVVSRAGVPVGEPERIYGDQGF